MGLGRVPPSPPSSEDWEAWLLPAPHKARPDSRLEPGWRTSACWASPRGLNDQPTLALSQSFLPYFSLPKIWFVMLCPLGTRSEQLQELEALNSETIWRGRKGRCAPWRTEEFLVRIWPEAGMGS